MSYSPNPKTAGSGIICAIPQKGACPFKCPDCFFQSGRGYLEPLDEKTPNLPDSADAAERVVRVNDGNDSSNDFDEVCRATSSYKHRFFNTSWPTRIDEFPGPVVLTLNPGKYTDTGPGWMPACFGENLMFIRFRTNTWNLHHADEAVNYWSKREVPVVLTFMAYMEIESIPEENRRDYIFRQRTSNHYWAISSEAWARVMEWYRFNKWVHSCGRVEGERGDTKCRWCGNCLREYFATKERMRT